jgi:nitrogen fixation-related uncharacterized protein
MEKLMFLAPVFIAGIVVGAVITSVWARLWSGKKRRSDLLAARERILAGLKEEHEKEILREIFKATDALSGELNSSLQIVRDLTERLLVQMRTNPYGHDQTPPI